MEKNNRVKAVISLDAVEQNFREMRKNIAEDTKMIAVVKADAYGHGAVPIAHLIENHDYIWGFAAATAEEAVHLRQAGITKPILILGIVFDEYFPELVQYDIRPAVCEYDEAKKLSDEAVLQNKTVHIHIALDTGMTRIGYADIPESVEEIKKIAELPNLEIEGMFTHFARADEYDRSPAMVQLERYQDFSKRVEEAGVDIPLHHCSNSAGIIRVPEANLSIVRAGITIYGIYPSSEVERDIVKLAPVMELKSHITYVKDVPAGAAISYGGTYVADKKKRVATIPVGYADGYPRQLSNKGWVLIHGKKAPILGRVCMDQFMADVTEIDNVKKGDEVTLLGRDGDEFISIEEMGDLCGRFSYEFACDISPRVPRVYIKDGKEAEVWYQGQKVF
ncbi:alanine racemase [Ruminococcus sp. AF37-6AT]|jgi:alanine racemase|nr:alanine racemase [uncultured Blautia sp.]RGI61360.1 alanine racemase [Ruminococcus sp. TM10-9AT]RGW20379.1 alanine racemase [Ruminococcus sp. AF13-37]RGW22355.1 alanine racemase [Ruminococcus sp. AF13-28]RGY92581.1 alanine racemase [Ruminococcus sp. AM58-7XD]RHD93892.1 alanine racemase [Ruminococcus sp. AM30-15AC]RHJ99902.1 alanine racemase [Ruminococcus sp. AM07-21]RHL49883.1 alanine racemase [Ruminococcus sp. AF37-6AT]RHP57769.1 alanine racemase [Ruminococcus sp. AF31-16BH]RHT52250.1 